MVKWLIWTATRKMGTAHYKEASLSHAERLKATGTKCHYAAYKTADVTIRFLQKLFIDLYSGIPVDRLALPHSKRRDQHHVVIFAQL